MRVAVAGTAIWCLLTACAVAEENWEPGHMLKNKGEQGGGWGHLMPQRKPVAAQNADERKAEEEQRKIEVRQMQQEYARWKASQRKMKLAQRRANGFYDRRRMANYHLIAQQQMYHRARVLGWR